MKAHSLYLGIDGGGTRTRTFVCDTTGTLAGWGESGATNPNQTGSNTIVSHFTEAIRAAFADMGRSPESVVSAFLGVSGVTDESGREKIRTLAVESGLPADRIGVDHDIRIALAGGLEGRPGIALIVGTGSSCYGRDADGRAWQSGGWGALVGDEGSGYFLGREALICAVRMADGRDPETGLKAAIFEKLGVRELSEIMARLYRPPLGVKEVAALAPLVLDLAEAGDSAAHRILERGANELAELLAANHRKLPTGPGPDVVVTGGLGTADRFYRRMIHEAIRRELPNARVQGPALSPAIGAALLAMEQAELRVTEQLLNNLARHSRG